MKLKQELKEWLLFITILILATIGIALIFAEPLDKELNIGKLILLKIVGFGSVLSSRYIWNKTFGKKYHTIINK